MKSQDFNFFIPFSDEAIEKASKGLPENRYKNMVLEGMASDNSKDLEGEVLEPAGYVTDYFLKSGWINYEHLSKKSAKFLIGEPLEAKVKGDEFHIKAKLWENSEVARDAWDKIIQMKESGSSRRAGWSIEGKSLSRDPMNPKRITKALITNVALTFSPVNGNSYADIAKGLQKEDYVEPVYETDTEDKEFILEFDRNGKKYRVGKDFKVFEVINKAMDTAAVKPLTPESLDKKPKVLEPTTIKKSIDNILKHKHLLETMPQLKEHVLSLIKNS